MRALAKDPETRFPSAEAFRQAIAAAAGGEPTEPLAGDTAVLPTTTAPLGPPNPPRRSWGAIALVTAILLGAGIAALALAAGDERPGGRRRAERTPPPEESPTAPAVLGVEEAAGALQELVTTSAEDGLVSEEVASKMLDESQKALDEYFHGNIEEAIKHLAEAETVIQVGLLDGSVRSEETGASLALTVEALEAAMLANPLAQETPDDEEEDEEDGEGEGNGGESGPGNSEDAPGQQKKEKDGD